MEVVGEGAQGMVCVYPGNAAWVVKVCKMSAMEELSFYTFFQNVDASVAPSFHGIVQCDRGQLGILLDRGRVSRVTCVKEEHTLQSMLARACIMGLVGVHHCDLKHTNMIVGSDGDIYLVDFGSATTTAHRYAGRFCTGTYGFMPPEAVLSMSAVPDPEKIDVWSIGVCILSQFVDLRTAACSAFFDPSHTCAYDHIVSLFKLFGTPQPGDSSLCDLAGFEGLHKWPNWPWKRVASQLPFVRAAGMSPVLLDLLDHMLVMDPLHRFGFQEVLHHAFMAAVRDKVQSHLRDTKTAMRLHETVLVSCLPLPHFTDALFCFRYARGVGEGVLLGIALPMFCCWRAKQCAGAVCGKEHGPASTWTEAQTAWMSLYVSARFLGRRAHITAFLANAGLSKKDALLAVCITLMNHSAFNPVMTSLTSPVLQAMRVMDRAVLARIHACCHGHALLAHAAACTEEEQETCAGVDPYAATMHEVRPWGLPCIADTVLDVVVDEFAKAGTLASVKVLVDRSCAALRARYCSCFCMGDEDWMSA
jgi:hypothetical protein